MANINQGNDDTFARISLWQVGTAAVEHLVDMRGSTGVIGTICRL